MNIKKDELFSIMTTMAELGAKNALIAAGIDKTEISLAEAYRRFSRKNVDAWIKSEKLNAIKRGAATKIKLMDLEYAAKLNPLTQSLT